MGSGQSLGIDKACPSLREQYERCQAAFLKDLQDQKSMENPCRDEWEDFQQCIRDHVSSHLRARRAAQSAASESIGPAEKSHSRETK